VCTGEGLATDETAGEAAGRVTDPSSGPAPRTWAASWSTRIQGDHLVRNSLFTMLAAGSMGGFGFLFWLVCAHLFTSAQIGVATTLISATILVSYFGQLGFEYTFVRFLPTSRDRNAEINTGLTLVGVASLVLSAAYILVAPTFVPALEFVRRSPLSSLVFVIFTAFTALNMLTDAIFIAYRSAKYNFLVDGLIQGTAKVVAPALMIGLGAFGIFAASTAAAVVGVGFSTWFLIRRFAYRLRLGVSPAVLRQVFGFSGLNYLASLLNMVPVLVVPAIVINGRGPSEAGYYYLAFQMANLLYALPLAISGALFSEGSHDGIDLRHQARRASTFLGILALPAVALATVGGHWLLLIFGSEYGEHARTALAVFGFAVPVVGLNMLSQTMLRLSRQLGALILSNVGFVVVVCGLAAAWVHRGLAWVALAWLLGNLVAGVSALVFWVAAGGRVPEPAA